MVAPHQLSNIELELRREELKTLRMRNIKILLKQGYVVTAWVKLGMQKYAEVDIVIRITLHYKADFMIKTVKTFHYDCEGYDGGGRCKSVTVFDMFYWCCS